MAPWVLMKLLHPFTPDDLLASRKIVSSLQLPPCTSQFVLALTDPQAPGKVVYILAVEKLSERSIADVHTLVAAVNPNSVVAFVDGQNVTDILDEEKLLNTPDSLDVPASLTDVIKSCFVNKIKRSVYESRAGLRVLLNIFGTTFYGNVFAAKKAAEESHAVFEYLRFPSTAISSFSEEEVEVGHVDETAEETQPSKVSYADRFLSALSGLLGGNNLECLTGVSQRMGALSRSSHYSQGFSAPASSILPTLTANAATSSGDSQILSSATHESSPNLEDSCPAFAVPFYPLFVDLHDLFKDKPDVNQALNFSRKLLDAVERGDEVEHQDLSRARLFRVAVESVRLSWNSFTQTQEKARFRLRDFYQLPYDEKCQALLAQALQHQARKLDTVVAIVDASNVPGIRKHWSTPVPPEVAAYAEHCFVAYDAEGMDVGGRTVTGTLLENPEAKAAVVVGAGAVAAAGLVSSPHWASASTFMKVFTLKVPTVLKLAWLQMKRQAVVSWAHALIPASKVTVPALKAAGSAKAAVVPSGAKAMLMKSAASTEKARVTAHSMVAAAERASFQAIRTAFYSLMRNRQRSKSLGPRPWLLLGGSLAAGAGVLYYGDKVEHALVFAPSAPSVVRLGRGLQNLDRASQAVSEYQGSSWWNRVYLTLYHCPFQQ